MSENSKIFGIYQADCLEGMSRISDSSIDMVFADPPFNLRKKYKTYKDQRRGDDYINWCAEWLCEIVRVVKPGGAIFVHNIPKWLISHAAILDDLADFKHWIAWNAPGSPRGKSLLPCHYGILYYIKDGKQAKFYKTRYPHQRCRHCKRLLKDYGGKKATVHPFGPLVSDVWTDLHRIRHNRLRADHPCQLPVALLERLILMSTDEGDSILDPFIGTGTTAVAAEQLGRKCVGFEISPEYTKIALDRVDCVSEKSQLGNAWVSFHLGQPATIRDIDWKTIAPFFIVPRPKQRIDLKAIQLRYPDNLEICKCHSEYSEPVPTPLVARAGRN